MGESQRASVHGEDGIWTRCHERSGAAPFIGPIPGYCRRDQSMEMTEAIPGHASARPFLRGLRARGIENLHPNIGRIDIDARQRIYENALQFYRGVDFVL